MTDETMASEAVVGAGPSSAIQTSSQPIYTSLHAVKNELRAGQPAHLHPLHSSTQASYDGQSEQGSHLSRDQFRQLIAQVRHSLGQFGETSPAFHAESRPPSAFEDQASTSDAVRRYISLLTEASTHTTALARSVEPLEAPLSERKSKSSILSTFLAASSSKPQQQIHDWTDAVQALSALNDTVEQIARDLGLETFTEASSDVSAPQAAEESTLTHTLTLGAKIIVIDLEFRAVRDASREFRPKCRMNLSYANDSEITQRDPELGLLLERYVQAVGNYLFGIRTTDPRSARESALESLQHFAACLEELTELDALCAKANEADQQVDLFDAMQTLSTAVVKVYQSEAASNSKEEVIDQGHGMASMHTSRPFLHTVFAKDGGGNDYNLHLQIRGLDLTPSTSARDSITPSFRLSSQLATEISDLGKGLPEHLGSIVVGSSSVPLYFVARLQPPVIVSRSTAATLANLCLLRPANVQNALLATTSPRKPSPWFEDILSDLWSSQPLPVQKSSNFTFTLARTVDSLRDASSQGLVVDSLPLLTCSPESSAVAKDNKASILNRLLSIIELLRDEVKLTELTRSAIATSTPSPNARSNTIEPTLDELLAGADAAGPARIPVTLSFSFPSASANTKGMDSLLLEAAFQIATKETPPRRASFVATISAAENGWMLEADVRLPNQSSGEQAVHLSRESSQSQAMVAVLSKTNGLDNVVASLIKWGENELHVQLDLPPIAQEAFDPLAYEQANVHAVYETIAPHFSSTRYKPWPLIPAFLDTLPPGSLGADLGCGNGKYLPLRSVFALETDGDEGAAAAHHNSLATVGVDRSSNLVGLARDNFGMQDPSKQAQTVTDRRQEVAVGDAIQSSLRSGVFDYAISIATIHHFSTWERRRAAVHELIRIVAPVHAPGPELQAESSADPRLNAGHGRGRFMIFVWALEQQMEGKRQFEAQQTEVSKDDRTIKDPNNDKSADRLVSYSGLSVAEKEARAQQNAANITDDQDVLVPWVLSNGPKHKLAKPKRTRTKNGVKERGATPEQDLDQSVSKLKLNANDVADEVASAAISVAKAPVYNRYYHVFRSGELETLVQDAAATLPVTHTRAGSPISEAVDVVCETSGWERGNWWGVWRVQWK